jgi:hypothetical protein
LLPLNDLSHKNIPIDAQSFWKIAKSVNKDGVGTGAKTDNDLTAWYFHVFDFSKIGFRTIQSLCTDRKKFW